MPAAYRPGLAERWERIDSLNWRFHLRPGARWHDGQPVTAEDVVFSFEAFADSALDAAARSYLAGRLRAAAEDSATVRISLHEPSPEQLYDATYHVRILPRHVWDSIPREQWAADTALAHLVGSGPYRVQDWKRGQFLTLIADSARARDQRAPPSGVRSGGLRPIPTRHSIWSWATKPISWKPSARRTGSSGSLARHQPSGRSPIPPPSTAFWPSAWLTLPDARIRSLHDRELRGR